jgi:hypothetical protein
MYRDQAAWQKRPFGPETLGFDTLLRWRYEVTQPALALQLPKDLCPALLASF